MNNYRVLHSPNLSEMMLNAENLYSYFPMQHFRKNNHFISLSYSEVLTRVKTLASAFQNMGIKKGTKVALFADNRQEWLVCDLALLLIGAVDVPRSSSTPPIQLKGILEHSGCEYLIAENDSFVHDIAGDIDKSRILTMDSSPDFKTIEALIEETSSSPDIPRLHPDDLATIIYTSGTTGSPKGVMLTHGNLMHNVRTLTPLLHMNPETSGGERALSILPTWHIFERTFEYCCIAGGTEISYSDIKHLAEDLVNNKPTTMCAVPRLWQSIHTKIMNNVKKESTLTRFIFNSLLYVRQRFFYSKKLMLNRVADFDDTDPLKRYWRYIYNFIIFTALFVPGSLSYFAFSKVRNAVGGRIRGVFTGGGSMPPYLDLFFNALGITLINAYGMTEASPGITGRRFERNTLFTVGIPFDETEIMICSETGERLPKGQTGIIWVKGPQVMKGYYNNPEETRKALTEDKWLITGDIGSITKNNELVITGRKKDTIVLLGGENVEPSPIEEKLEQDELISHAIIVGHNEKHLGALLVLEQENIRKLFEEWNEDFHSIEDAVNHSRVIENVRKNITRLVNESREFHPFERVKEFRILDKNFDIDKELTRTLKKKRDYILAQYRDIIDQMFGRKKS
ncbi:MAG: AMP-binding protein [bacterium]